MTGLISMPRVEPVGRSLDDSVAASGSVGNAYKYCHGSGKPHFPVPALIVTFDYWPAEETESGRSAVYGQDYYKPGRWREFLCIE